MEKYKHKYSNNQFYFRHFNRANSPIPTKSTKTLSIEEEALLKTAIEEYDDLFPKIMVHSKANFMSLLEKYITISSQAKNIDFNNQSMSKILQIINVKYYNPEYTKVQQLIQSIDNIQKYPKYTLTSSHIPHCNKDISPPVHRCGDALYNMGDEYFLCLKCQKIYKPSYVLFRCSLCKIDYYTSILSKQEQENPFKPATWAGYHCSIVVNDTMKCSTCQSTLHLNQINGKLCCLTCKYEKEQKEFVWECLICKNPFKSEAKIYNPLEYKTIKIAVKKTICNAIPARPLAVPCCNIPQNEIENYTFYHKKTCSGVLYKGFLNKKKIIVCSKCQLLYNYDVHLWYCPICKHRFKQDQQPTPLIAQYETNDNSTGFPIGENNSHKSNKSSQSQQQTNEQEAEVPRSEIKFLNPNDNNNNKLSLLKKARHYDSSFKRFNTLIEKGKSFDKEDVSDFSLPNNAPLKADASIPNYNNEDQLPRYNSNNDNEISNINVNLHINVNINNITNNKLQKLENIRQGEELKRKSLHINSFDIDDYTIIKQIGQGTFAKIYEVIDRDYKKYAMKKILASSVDEINALIGEYDMLKSLSIYNLSLVNIYAMNTKQLDKTTHAMYLLMDLAIRDWEKEIEYRGKRNQFYTETELITILKNLTQTFAELQRHNVSHRDIKPQNILLLPDGSFRISDFGEAKRIIRTDKQTVRQTIRGTELYMSPILFKALKTTGIQDGHTLHNTYKSDVYSLGLCFVLAATLTFRSLSSIRELEDMTTMKNRLNQYLKNNYSSKFIEIIYLMIQIDEKLRVDFIELEKQVAKI